jgi:hypothetical protein
MSPSKTPSLRLYAHNKSDPLTASNETFLSVLCLSQAPAPQSEQSSDDQPLDQYAFCRVKIFPLESLDEEEGQQERESGAEQISFTEITHLVTTTGDASDGSFVETVDLSVFVKNVQESDGSHLEQRLLPQSVNMSVSDMLYAPTRGVSCVLLSRKNVPEGVIVFDMEEDEDDENEDEEGEEREEGEEGVEESDDEEDTMVI